MRLNQIRDFIAVVEAGSVRAAARTLRIAQPTLTKSVRGLEAELHARLLERSARGVTPTPAGRAFYSRARVAQIELRNAEAEVARLGGANEGAVALGVGPAVSSAVLPHALAAFRQHFPRARLAVTEALGHVLWPRVRDATLDLAVGLRPLLEHDSILRFRPLARMGFAVVARKGHPLHRARSLADLIEAEWVTLLPPDAAGNPLTGIFSAFGLMAPRPSVECDSHATLVTLLSHTDMVGTISRWMLSEPQVRTSLEEIGIAEGLPSLTVGIITRSEPFPTPVAVALARALAAATRARRATLPG